MEISRSELQYLLDLQLKKYIDQLQPTIAIVVEDTLNSLGIATDPPRNSPFTGKPLAFFYDPDGLPLEVIE